MSQATSSFPLVSIVIPVYKPNHYFADLLDSVLSQTYPNFEVNLSDDAPKAFPKELIEQKGKEKIKYFVNNGKKGIFPNLNHAIRQAEGKYIQIFCQDDIMYPSCLVEQVEGLEKYPSAGMVFSDYNTLKQGAPFKKKSKSSAFSLTSHQTAINKYVSRGCLPGNLSPVMLRKKALEKVGYFNEEFVYAGDFEYWVRLSLAGFDYVYNSACLLTIRVHSERASQNLPYMDYVKENTIIYQQLLQHQTIKKSKWKVKSYINEKNGIRLLKGLLRRTEGKQYSFFDKMRLLNQSPFNLFLIISFLFISLNGRLQLFTINEKKDF